MKEKFITEKGGAYVVRVKWMTGGKAHYKQIGTFRPADYGGKRAALSAARFERDKFLSAVESSPAAMVRTWTVSALFNESLELLRLTARTRKEHERIYNSAVPDDLKGKPISKITTADIQKSLNAYAETATAGKLETAVTVWRQIYRAAAAHDVPVPDRSAGIIMPKAKVATRRNAKHADAATVDAFFEYLETRALYEPGKVYPDLLIICRILQYTGIRPQEVLALEKSDIDLLARKISITKSVGSTKTETRQIIATKTPESVRAVPVPDDLARILQEWLAGKPAGLLFRDSSGLPYNIEYLSGVVFRLCKQCGAKVTLYSFRHNFASDLRKENPKTLQSLMGHASPVMSLNYADSVTDDEKAAAVSRRRFS